MSPRSSTTRPSPRRIPRARRCSSTFSRPPPSRASTSTRPTRPNCRETSAAAPSASTPSTSLTRAHRRIQIQDHRQLESGRPHAGPPQPRTRILGRRGQADSRPAVVESRRERRPGKLQCRRQSRHARQHQATPPSSRRRSTPARRNSRKRMTRCPRCARFTSPRTIMPKEVKPEAAESFSLVYGDNYKFSTTATRSASSARSSMPPGRGECVR